MEAKVQNYPFTKGQRVVAVDGRYEARVEQRHKDGTITIRQGFCLRDGEPVSGSYLGNKYRIKPVLVVQAES